MRAAVIVALLAGQAGAYEPYVPSPRMTPLPAADGCIARVRIENRYGVYNRTETVQTDAGPVVITYTTIGGHQPGDDDRIEVVGLPPDVFARPMEAMIVDGETLEVCLFEFIGG